MHSPLTTTVPLLLLLLLPPTAAGATPVTPIVAQNTGGSFCFPAPHDANCVTWATDAVNITLSAHFAADADAGVPVWGAWGLPALSCGNMWPASVWLALPSPSGGVRIEDRVAVTHAAPACDAKAPQLSHTLSGSVAGDGSIDVSWTRPLEPPRAYRQPSIAAGATPLIGAYALGASAFAFPPCATAGLPFHSNVVNGASVDFVAGGAAASSSASRAVAAPSFSGPSLAAAAAPSLSGSSLAAAAAAPSSGLPRAAPYSGLAGIASVCGDSCAALTHVDASSGRVSFPTSASPSLFPLLTALDASSRVVHVLAFNNSPAGPSPALFVASLSADTGALLGTCATRFALNDAYDYANLNFAFDAARGEVLIASCTDSACVAPANVTALRPGSCATRDVAALAAEELTVGGSGAVDPYARVFVFSLARGGAKPGLALVALNISSGALVRVTPETQDVPYVQSLVFDDVSRLVYGLAFTTAAHSQPTLVSVNARTGKLRVIAAVAGCDGALPDSLAVSADGAMLFFVGTGADGSATLFSVFAANATVAAATPLQGITIEDASAALFWLP